jgi:hypothetical protein
MPPHTANPIIQIIDGNKKNVRLRLLRVANIQHRDAEHRKQQAGFIEYFVIHNQCG